MTIKKDSQSNTKNESEPSKRERMLEGRVMFLEAMVEKYRGMLGQDNSMQSPSSHDESEKTQALEDALNPDGSSFELFSVQDLRRLKAVKLNHDHLVDKFKNIQEFERMRALIRSTQDRINAVEALGKKYKNFSSFIEDFVVPQLYLQMLTGEPLRLQNFCLVGPPGIGKTAFLSDLSESLELGGAIFDANSIQAAAVLNGLTRQYSNADVGLIFQTMIFGRTYKGKLLPANALFCVDEIEKMGTTNQLGSTFDLMLALLERQTAKRFVDVCAPELKLNLEHINWGFTSNSLASISAPLRSRLIHIEIPAPTPEQSIEIATSIYEQEISKIKDKVDRLPDLEYAELEKLSKHSPREQKQVIQLAIAKAVRNRSAVMELDDLGKKSSVRMGFL